MILQKEINNKMSDSDSNSDSSSEESVEEIYNLEEMDSLENNGESEMGDSDSEIEEEIKYIINDATTIIPIFNYNSLVGFSGNGFISPEYLKTQNYSKTYFYKRIDIGWEYKFDGKIHKHSQTMIFHTKNDINKSDLGMLGVYTKKIRLFHMTIIFIYNHGCDVAIKKYFPIVLDELIYKPYFGIKSLELLENNFIDNGLVRLDLSEFKSNLFGTNLSEKYNLNHKK